jgi:hypothetical protein
VKNQRCHRSGGDSGYRHCKNTGEGTQVEGKAVQEVSLRTVGFERPGKLLNPGSDMKIHPSRIFSLKL